MLNIQRRRPSSDVRRPSVQDDELMDKASTPLRAVGPPGTPPSIVDVQQKYTAVEGEFSQKKVQLNNKRYILKHGIFAVALELGIFLFYS